MEFLTTQLAACCNRFVVFFVCCYPLRIRIGEMHFCKYGVAYSQGSVEMKDGEDAKEEGKGGESIEWAAQHNCRGRAQPFRCQTLHDI